MTLIAKRRIRVTFQPGEYIHGLSTEEEKRLVKIGHAEYSQDHSLFDEPQEDEYTELTESILIEDYPELVDKIKKLAIQEYLTTPEDYDSLKYDELKELVLQRQITPKSNKKEDLIEALKFYDLEIEDLKDELDQKNINYPDNSSKEDLLNN